MAQFDKAGVSQATPVFPVRIRFAPHSDVKMLYPADFPGDTMEYLN